MDPAFSGRCFLISSEALPHTDIQRTFQMSVSFFKTRTVVFYSLLCGCCYFSLKDSWEKYSHSCRQKSWNSEPYCTLEHQQVKGFKLIWHPYLSPCGTELVQDLVSVLAALASVVGKVGQCFIDHSLDPTSVVEELCDTQSRSINTLSRENGLWIFMSHITFSFFLCWQSRLVYILHNLLPNM